MYRNANASVFAFKSIKSCVHDGSSVCSSLNGTHKCAKTDPFQKFFFFFCFHQNVSKLWSEVPTFLSFFLSHSLCYCASVSVCESLLPFNGRKVFMHVRVCFICVLLFWMFIYRVGAIITQMLNSSMVFCEQDNSADVDSGMKKGTKSRTVEL